MSQENVEVVREIYAALTRRDIDAALALSEPDAVHDWSRSVGPYAGIYSSHAEMRDVFETFVEAVEEMTWEIDEAIVAGSRVLAVIRLTIRGQGSGVEAVGRGAHLWTVESGKVVGFEFFQDKEEALEAVGLRE